MSFGDDTLDPLNTPRPNCAHAFDHICATCWNQARRPSLDRVLEALGTHWLIMLPRAEWEIGHANRDYLSFVKKESAR